MPANKMIQFLHPGSEHTSRSGQKWNTGPHRRKFQKHTGEYIINGKREKGHIHFWGEWEAQSDFQPVYSSKSSDGFPLGIFSPWYSLASNPENAQNTDPFVFGCFIYSVCRKFKNGRATLLNRNLVSGDVILFGSSLHGEFVLDTVFVVKEEITITKNDYKSKLKNSVPKSYNDTVLSVLFRHHHSQECTKQADEMTIHFGATYDDPVDGMYSFVPCLPANKKSNLFARPVIKHPGISGKLNTNFKVFNNHCSDIRLEWENILGQVIKNNLLPAVAIDDVEER